jgi:hypothetical protein
MANLKSKRDVTTARVVEKYNGEDSANISELFRMEPTQIQRRYRWVKVSAPSRITITAEEHGTTFEAPVFGLDP